MEFPVDPVWLATPAKSAEKGALLGFGSLFMGIIAAIVPPALRTLFL
jgi:hypothetical protein